MDIKQNSSVVLMLEGYSRLDLKEYAQEIICAEINPDEHPDLHILQPLDNAKQISIDQVRALQQRLTRKPAIHNRHIVVIDMVEMLSLSAANSLLKALEEPAGLCFSILLTKNTDLVLPTIASRCFKVSLPVKYYDNLYTYISCLFPNRNAFTEQMFNDWYEGNYINALSDIFTSLEQIDIIMIMLCFYMKTKYAQKADQLYNKIISFKKATSSCSGLDEQLMLQFINNSWSNIRRN